VTPYFSDDWVTVYHGDALHALKSVPDASVHCCVTSPPYWGLRSYLPDTVKLRADLSSEDVAAVEQELLSLGIFPIGGGV